MILIGQYDSPFVRRTAIALDLCGMTFEHRPWSTFGDGDLLATFNPLRRVPTLVLDDGGVLIDSVTIVDWLDETVGPGRALVPAHGLERRLALKVRALGMGLADKAVSLLYERILHQDPSQVWIDRCRTQIADVLTSLETDRVSPAAPFWHGDSLGHADIIVGCALRFIREAHPDLFDPARWPGLEQHAARCEALPVFERFCQVLVPPGQN